MEVRYREKGKETLSRKRDHPRLGQLVTGLNSRSSTYIITHRKAAFAPPSHGVVGGSPSFACILPSFCRPTRLLHGFIPELFYRSVRKVQSLLLVRPMRRRIDLAV